MNYTFDTGVHSELYCYAFDTRVRGYAFDTGVHNELYCYAFDTRVRVCL